MISYKKIDANTLESSDVVVSTISKTDLIKKITDLESRKNEFNTLIDAQILDIRDQIAILEVV